MFWYMLFYHLYILHMLLVEFLFASQSPRSVAQNTSRSQEDERQVAEAVACASLGAGHTG